jgi:hypothetical protein
MSLITVWPLFQLRYKNYWFVLRKTDTKRSSQLECYDDNLSIFNKKANETTKLKSALAIGKRQAKEKTWAFEILCEETEVCKYKSRYTFCLIQLFS